MPRSKHDWAAIVCCLFYLALGLLWIDKPGLQADELLFAEPIFERAAAAETITIFHRAVPTMLMSYLGCLKTLLYWPLFKLFGASAAVVRTPVLLLGAFSIWMIYRIVARVHSAKAGLLVAVLMATDTLYLWLSRCDWGPVTLQHVLTLGGVWMLLHFDAGRRPAWLGGACFLFGLALWDKTVFLWPAAALLAGGALLWRRVLALLTPARVALALVCFAAGAFPWIRHNVRTRGATFQETGHFEASAIPRKARQFVDGMNGVSLLGYVVRDRMPVPGPPAAVPHTWLAQVSVALGRQTGFPRQSIRGWVFAACLAAALFVNRQTRIAAGMFAAGFLLMALTKGGGEWAYHSSVLWPLPHILIVFVLLRLPWPVLAAGMAACILPSLAVTNTHFANLHLYGSSSTWTDAIYALPAAIDRHSGGEPVEVADWGILEPVTTLSLGKTRVNQGIDRTGLKRGAIYVTHVSGLEEFPDSNSRLIADAKEAGCALQVVDVVKDTLGVPVFQLQRCD